MQFRSGYLYLLLSFDYITLNYLSITTLFHHWLLFIGKFIYSEFLDKYRKGRIHINNLITSCLVLLLHSVNYQTVWAEHYPVKLPIKVNIRPRRCQSWVSKWSPSSRNDSCLAKNHKKTKRWLWVGKVKLPIVTVNIFQYPNKKHGAKKGWCPHYLPFAIWNLRTHFSACEKLYLKTSTNFASEEWERNFVAVHVKDIGSFPSLLAMAVVCWSCRERYMLFVYNVL